MLRAPQAPGPDALRLTEDLYVVDDPVAVRRIIKQAPPEARYFVGGMLWDEDEMEEELEAGIWLIAEASPELLLRKDTETLWAELIVALTGAPAPSGPILRHR